MRLLDRYVLREFLLPLMVCLGGFLVFWVAFDLFGELEMLQREHATLGGVLRLYAIRLPQLLTTILPVGTLLALLYAITQHARHQELTAMRAAGLSLWRICAPYYVTGVALSFGLYLVSEVLAPNAREREEELRASWSHPGASAVDFGWRNKVDFRNEADSRLWTIGAFNVVTEEMRNPQVAWYLSPEAYTEITAESGQWINGYWKLTNGLETFHRMPDDPTPARQPKFSLTTGEMGGADLAAVTNWPAATLVVSNAVWRTNLTAPGPLAGGVWTISSLNPTNGEFHRLRAVFKVRRRAQALLMASEGRWTNGAWTFSGNGHEYLWRSGDDPAPFDATFAEHSFPELTETPAVIRSESRVVAQLAQSRLAKKPELSSREVLDYKRLHPKLAPRDAAVLDTQLAARFAAPWTCLVVALIAVPFGAPSGRRNIFYGVAGSIALAFVFFVVQRVSFAMGQRGALDPQVAAWAPNAVFALVGVALTTRVR